MPRPAEVFHFIGRNSKRIAVSIVGGVVLLAGVAMLVFPGPAVLVIPLGFAILGTEYAWAAAAVEKSKRLADSAGKQTKRGVKAVKRKVTGSSSRPPRVR